MTWLLFDLRKVPRTLSKIEWKKAWRDKRLLENSLRKHNADEMKMLQTQGHKLSDKQRKDLIDRIVNPPIVLGPYQ